jgi:hypothetical protein
MRITKALAVGITGCALAGAAAIPAVAGSSHAHPATGKHGTFSSKLSPKVAHPGTVLKLKAHGAKKKTTYTCVFTAVKGKMYAADTGALSSVVSNKHGKFTCSKTFEPFHGKLQNGTKVSCPLSKKNKKAGVKCGFAASTIDMKSNTIQYFKAKH